MNINPDVLLTHGYFLDEDSHDLQTSNLQPPAGMLYLCAHLQSRGFSVEVFDSNLSPREALFARLRTGRPTTLGVYTNTVTHENVIDILAVARLAGWTTVVGQLEPSDYTDDYLDAGAQFVVIDTGEGTMEQLLRAINAGVSPARLQSIYGIAFLDDQGIARQTMPRPQISNHVAQPITK